MSVSIRGNRARTGWRIGAALTLLIGIVVPVWSTPPVLAQGSLPESAAAAPEGTVLFHAIDLDREGGQWQQTGTLLERVGLPDALELWEAAVLEESANTGGPTAADLDALLGGEMAIVVSPQAVERVAARYAAHQAGDAAVASDEATPVGRSRGPGQGVAAILVPSDPDAAWSYAEGQLNDLAMELDAKLQESTYGDADLLTVSRRDGAVPSSTDSADPMEVWLAELDPHDRGRLVAAHAGDYIIVGSHEADVRSIIDVIDGNQPSLADSTEAQAVAAELPADALSFTYVDGQGIIDGLGPELTGMLQSAAPQMPQEAWGGQFGFAISADTPGFRFDTITIPSPEAASSMLVANDPGVMAAAEQAPAGTFAFEAGKLPETAYASAPYLLAQAVNSAMSGDSQANNQATWNVPTPEEMEAEIAKAAVTLGFDPAADLFDLLGFDFIAFSSFPSITMDSVDLDAVAAVSTTDPDALAQTVEKIAALIERSGTGAEISTRSVDGDTLYIVSDPETQGAPAIEFGVVGDQLAFSIGNGIEDLTTEPASSLADNEQFQTVMGALPSEYHLIGYLDIGQAIDSIVMLVGALSGTDISGADSTPSAGVHGPENIRALAAVAFERDGMAGGSAILYIAEPQS